MSKASYSTSAETVNVSVHYLRRALAGHTVEYLMAVDHGAANVQHIRPSLLHSPRTR